MSRRNAIADPAGAKRAATAPRVAAQRIADTRARTLEPEVKGEMENRLGHHFGDVRVHTEADAAELATGLGARAFTVGRDIAFASGAYRPAAAEGRRLIAHELAHVVQQRNVDDPARATQLGEPRYEAEAHRAATRIVARGGPVALSRISGTAVVQRDDAAGQGAQAAQGGITVTIVIRAPDDKFTNDVTDYARNTLNDQNVIEADNLDEAIAQLEKMTRGGGPKIKTLRIIGHGSTTGGIKMTPKGGTQRQFVTAQELEKLAQDKNLQSKAAGAMDQDATVEFWGCYVGSTQQTGEALSTLFQSEFRSTGGSLHTGFNSFTRPPDKGEKGDQDVTSSAEIDARAGKNPNLKKGFEKWLLQQYDQLAANGDIAPQPKRADRIKAMREVFDRSKGKIKQLVIEESGGKVTRRSDKSKWAAKWKSVKVKGNP